jgi:hypothetical protein
LDVSALTAASGSSEGSDQRQRAPGLACPAYVYTYVYTSIYVHNVHIFTHPPCLTPAASRRAGSGRSGGSGGNCGGGKSGGIRSRHKADAWGACGATPVTTTLTLSRTAIADIAPRSSPASLPSSASPMPRGPGIPWCASAPTSSSCRRPQTSARTLRASVEWRWWRGSDAMAAAGGAGWELERGVVGTRHAHMMPSSSPANSRQRSDMLRAVPPARNPARLPLRSIGLTSGVTEKASAMTVALPPSLAHT